MKKQNCLIYCNCGAGIIPNEKQNSLAESFKELNIDVFELHDICAFSLNEKEVLHNFEKQYDKKFIVACYPRAIQNIFKQNKITLANYEVLNFRELSTETIVENVQEKITEDTSDSNYEVLKSSLDVPAWYPIIDESRCTLCGQCARFCVFGVYKYNKKSLEVVNPLSCKNNCPACGRTCPASAIIFPRLPENSVLSGAEPGSKAESAKPEKKEGLFVLLNERNNARRNIFKQGVMQQAEAEKLKAIEEFKKGLEKK
ncbi:4Fe-4S binding protein [uncultured Draconibacterium sp.]|uniref:ATP-binding protein n=1 Tax=uncultured Draconibacterium sp. TaxID=1573823 RepID=UPI0032168D63